jgi:hypothetical protein
LGNDDERLDAGHVAPNAEVRSGPTRSAIRFIVPDSHSLRWLNINVFMADFDRGMRLRRRFRVALQQVMKLSAAIGVGDPSHESGARTT